MGIPDDALSMPVTREELVATRQEMRATREQIDAVQGEYRTTETLKAVRASATIWQTTLTAILGILGLGSILGRDSVQALASHDQAIVIIALVISVLFAAAALFYVTKAAAGLPEVVFAGKAARQSQLIEIAAASSASKAGDAAENLRVSLYLTTVSLAAALVTVGYLWGAPDASGPSKVKLSVKVNGVSSSYCGTITEGPDGAMTVAPGPGNAQSATFPANQVTAIGPC